LDVEGRILSWNPSANRTYGFGPDEVVGKTFFDLVVPDNAGLLDSRLKALTEGGQFKEEDAVHRTSDGREIPVSMTVSAIHAPRAGYR
jgi:PAS domain S-box-containing protein